MHAQKADRITGHFECFAYVVNEAHDNPLYPGNRMAITPP
jgi:hypothetical protein